MKKNILAILIAGTFIVACSDAQLGKSIQAFDGPVQFADVVADCGAGEIKLGQTDYYGTVSSSNFAIINTPELCKFTATGNADSVDVSNNKAMPNISYVIPRELLSLGDSITLSPLTTLIAKQIDADVTPRSVAEVVTQVVTDLYGVDFINANASLNLLDLALDMEGTIKKLDSASVSLVTATNNVASDVLIYSQAQTDADALDVATIITTSKSVAAKVVADNPDYPSVVNEPMEVTVVTVNVKTAVDTPDATIEDLVDTETSNIADLPIEPVPATGGSNF
jgi:hypothetical protein